MRSLGEIFGFEQPKKTKATELQVSAPNPYIENVVRSMFWKNDIKFNSDSTSFVLDGYLET